MSAAGFDAASLERRYAFLDECPDQFFEAVVTLPVGSLPERVQGVRAWREALLRGQLPPADTWPSPDVAAPARQALAQVGVARFCKDQPDLVDALLTDILESFRRQAEAVRSEIAERLRELEALERRKQTLGPEESDEIDLDDLRKRAEKEAREAVREIDRTLESQWDERARGWAAISEVFGDLGALLGRGWDLTRGVLRHIGWSDLVRLRSLLADLPQLQEIVRSLGRLQVSEAEATVTETVFVPVRRLEEELREVWTPHIPAETRGIERSGEIARMLPAEAVNLGHPKLRFLWHARRAERALLTYRVAGIEIERTLVERESERAVEQQRPRPERGPIIAVLDTSGSMHGLPERVAKALVLEALRTAHAEKRRCLLYCYSGPGQIVEHELSLTADGLGRLLAFLGLSFGGGNDEAGVMARVIERLEQQEWHRADVVFVSDGEWPAPRSLVRAVEQAKETNTRFHGVQIGNRGGTGLHAICDPVHVFQDWAAVGGW